jgi:hypothetical protein
MGNAFKLGAKTIYPEWLGIASMLWGEVVIEPP